MTRVLVAEDDAVSRDLLGEILRGEGYAVDAVDDGADAIARAGGGYDLVVSDVRMEGAGGFEVLRAFGERAPGTPVILITAFGDVTGAMEAIAKGAYDYVSKPFNVAELRQTVARALERKRLSAQAEAAGAHAERPRISEIEGKSPRMLEVYKLVARVAPTTATVLVVGESGTGKELVAHAIHQRSARAGKPFVPVNCTALSESLLESELFGHARGAFTGAVSAKRGLFDVADGGTLFLDEIGDMGPKMQAQLLRTLQDGEVRPVGGTESIRVDVRLVCATNRDLEAEVRAGRFREDLYFRINVVTVRLPPLRDRAEDIPILASHVLAKIGKREGRPAASLSPEAIEALGRYAWPGNVRELENAIERAVAVAEGRVILPSDLPLPPRRATPAPAHPADERTGDDALVADRPTLAELERRYIALVVSESGGNKKKAAERLGIDRRTLYRALERAGLASTDDDADE